MFNFEHDVILHLIRDAELDYEMLLDMYDDIYRPYRELDVVPIVLFEIEDRLREIVTCIRAMEGVISDDPYYFPIRYNFEPFE